jgi:hypothetical protein
VNLLMLENVCKCMTERQTAVLRSIEYDAAEYSHYYDEVFIDNKTESVDRMPEDIPSVINDGRCMSVDRT